MSMAPVTPGKFNPVLGATMAGAIVTAQVFGSVISGLASYRWISRSSASYCRFIVGLSKRTHQLTHELAATMVRSELVRAQTNLAKWADDSHAYLQEHFEPNFFREAALHHLRHGNDPKKVAHAWVNSHFRVTLDFLDGIQSARMKDRPDEWRQVERFKQDLVNYWGENGLDISRSYGREYDYVSRRALKVIAKCIGYPLLGILVVVSAVLVAAGLGI